MFFLPLGMAVKLSGYIRTADVALRMMKRESGALLAHASKAKAERRHPVCPHCRKRHPPPKNDRNEPDFNTFSNCGSGA